MHIVNPSGVKFTNKYLSWFRCLGLGDHGFGGAANEGNKSVLCTPRELLLWQHNFCSAREQASSLRAAHLAGGFLFHRTQFPVKQESGKQCSVAGKLGSQFLQISGRKAKHPIHQVNALWWP